MLTKTYLETFHSLASNRMVQPYLKKKRSITIDTDDKLYYD